MYTVYKYMYHDVNSKVYSKYVCRSSIIEDIGSLLNVFANHECLGHIFER